MVCFAGIQRFFWREQPSEHNMAQIFTVRTLALLRTINDIINSLSQVPFTYTTRVDCNVA